MSKLPFFLFSSLLASSSALASSLNCNKHPSCEEMGYSKDDVPNCKEYLYCLYDPSYKVCLPDCDNAADTPTCPEGTMTEAQCTAQNGVFKDGTLNADTGCGECLTCDGTLYKRGTFNKIPEGLGCDPLNYHGSSTNSDMCCKACECPNGTLLTATNNKITKPNPGENAIYCVSGSVTLDYGMYSSGDVNQPTHIHFLPSTCSSSTSRLTIKQGHFDKVTSKVNTIIGGKEGYFTVVPHFSTLTLENGGKFYGPMESSNTGATCEITLNMSDAGGSGIVYDFTESHTNIELDNPGHNPVKCVGFSTTRYDLGYLNFGRDPQDQSEKSGWMTGYGFHAGCKGAVCKKQKFDGNKWIWIDGHISSNGGVCE